MIARGVVLVAAFAFVTIAACGGKTDSSSSVGSTAPPGGTSVPGQPPPTPTTPATPPSSAVTQIANDLADAYCGTFAKCCQSSGLPPIDFARCREVTSQSVSRTITGGGTQASTRPEAVQQCISAVATRTGACSSVDYLFSGVSAFFAPTSVLVACSALLGIDVIPPSGPTCSVASPTCSNGAKCFIDACVDAGVLGGPCVDDRCEDGPSCNAGTCEAVATKLPGAACAATSECRLGLVCAKGICDAARVYPELYEERSSPYRVGADTCRAFSTL